MLTVLALTACSLQYSVPFCQVKSQHILRAMPIAFGCLCPHIRRSRSLRMLCSIQEGNADTAVATVQLFAAPIEQGMDFPAGVRQPIYTSFVKQVSTYSYRIYQAYLRLVCSKAEHMLLQISDSLFMSCLFHWRLSRLRLTSTPTSIASVFFEGRTCLI